jgi:hypothetical protein
MFLSTSLSSSSLNSTINTTTISIPYDFTHGSQHTLMIQPVVTVSRNINPQTAGDSWADTRNEFSGGILVPNQTSITIPTGSTTFNQNINVNYVQRIIAGTTGGYTWNRGTYILQITFDLVRNLLQITPQGTTGTIPDATRPVAVLLQMFTQVS